MLPVFFHCIQLITKQLTNQENKKMSNLFRLGLLSLAIIFVFTQFAQAHFPWLEVATGKDGKAVLHCYFSEGPGDRDGDLLNYVQGSKVWKVPGRGEAAKVSLKKGSGSLELSLSEREAGSVFVLQKDLGVMNRGDAEFLLRYYSKTGPTPASWTWKRAKTEKLNDLDVIPSMSDGVLSVTVKFQGKPVAGAEVTFYNTEDEYPTLKTNKDGVAEFKLSRNPVKAVRVKHVEQKSGEHEGKSYADVRHYSTVTFPAVTYHKIPTEVAFPDIPEEVTSFGAAVSNGQLFVYGGHTGSAHEYSHEGQAHTLRSLDLKSNKGWKELGTGPHLQGLAMVAHKGKLYRLGGFTAKNKEGEEHDLWSQNSAACFDISSGKWTDLPALPEARSSFDAAVLDGKIYVVGGWKMAGDSDSVWHKTAWSLDLTKPGAEWVALPEAPFQRRALSVAAFNGKLYVIGGMQKSGQPTTRTAIFDPKTNEWSEGPNLIGESMAGFGTSSFAVNNQLYVSTFGGTFQRLSQDGKSWELLGNLENARFFHRMLPLDKKRLVFVGGSNMSVGKFSEVEVLDVSQVDSKPSDP